MSYSSFLSNTIKNSGYSLRSIASLCEKKYNVKITASYLSKLQKESNQNPASEKVNIAIAKVCGINPDDLLFEADLERAPENVKEIVETMVTFIKNMFIQFSSSFVPSTEEEKEIFEESLNEYLNMGTREFVQKILENDDCLDFENPFDQSIAIKDSDDNLLEDIFLKFSTGLTLLDNSMFPIIKQGAKLELVSLDEYHNGDIVCVVIDGVNFIRTYIDAGKNITFLPANTEFETFIIPKNKVNISGKVKSYTIEL